MNTIQAFPNLPVTSEYTWRPARQQDASAIYQMLLDIETVDQRGSIMTLDDVLRDFENPECNPATDTLLALSSDGKVAASGWVFSPPATEHEVLVWVSGEVHPAHRRRGLGDNIMTWMETRARQILATQPGELKKIIRTNTPEDLLDRLELFEQHGFLPVRSSYRMRRDLDQSIPGWSVPEGVTLSLWESDLDLETLMAFNSSFSDHWGAIPYSEELWRLWLTGHPSFHPELSFQAIVEDQSRKRGVIGFCLSKIKEAPTSIPRIQEGWIQELGVIRQWRKKGVATALLCAAMQAFQQVGLDYAGLDVDTENLSGALRIYERLGFYPIQRVIFYQLSV
jgi:mycothiol synthase